MAEISRGTLRMATFDLTDTAMDPVTFKGPCLAIGCINGGFEKDSLHDWRIPTLLTGHISGITAGTCGSIDYDDTAGNNSPGPQSLTIFVPTAEDTGMFIVTGGHPKMFTVTLVKMPEMQNDP